MQNAIKNIYDETKYLLLISAILFVLSLLFGFYLENEVEGAFFSGNGHSTTDIIENNLKASVPFLLGFISLGVSTIGALLINGVAIGGSVVASADHLTSFQIICLLIPHGIVEVPALLFSSSIGFYSLKLLFAFFRGKEMNVKHEGRTIFHLIVLVVVLFCIAGVVEGNITPLFYPN